MTALTAPTRNQLALRPPPRPVARAALRHPDRGPFGMATAFAGANAPVVHEEEPSSIPTGAPVQARGGLTLRERVERDTREHRGKKARLGASYWREMQASGWWSHRAEGEGCQ